uniref:gastrula zinc finger protein XlCGF9.1-like n=1 Tax=Oncorhynchus gorbuscha TaxID=8017 RepID=UPI001EAECC91|nr:gastrula zinc finger protein XlCGF9.1-like [Oncorhynchus gorbuscha]
MGKRPFVCSACGKDFPNLKGLNRHDRVHGDQCPQCSKTFVYRFGLTKHEQMVHSGVCPFACPTSGKRFAIRRDMETHGDASLCSHWRETVCLLPLCEAVQEACGAECSPEVTQRGEETLVLVLREGLSGLQ